MRFGEAQLDVGATVSQMDANVAVLRDAWDRVNSQWAVMLTQGLVDAADARLASLKGLIGDLDVGGVARQHVFFPLPGQTQEDAWSTWRDTAEYVRTGLAQVGGLVSKWSLSSVLPRIGQDVGNQFAGVGTWVLWVVGGLVALEALRAFRGSRQLSGYSRKRRRR